MESSHNHSAGRLSPIARASGGLAMVAIDQRESLRAMFQAKQEAPVSDATLKDFKVAVAETLGGTASAMLFDRDFGLPALERIGAVHGGCGRILAVDRLIQPPGGPVNDTDLDERADLEAARAAGVDALKFLIFWKGPASAARCRALAQRFVDWCRRENFISVLEAMVRPPVGEAPERWDREKALIDAAGALAESGPDLYKGELPRFGKAPEATIAAECAAITKAIGCPWVVLSQGVDRADFPAAVRAARAGGAAGFLAGRAIWADLVGPGDYRERLRTLALPRLQALATIVDAAAAPA
jgi:sulfofructosephosphate aldolase